MRTGTIVRKDLWTVFPEWREEFLADITPEEISKFIRIASQQKGNYPDNTTTGGRPSFTAREFFRLCALGYAANHYEGTDLPPVEQYKLHADGRDDGLTEIDPDSTEAFVDWLDIFGIGHPWEVCRGGNSTHVDCGVYKNDNGFSFSWRGHPRAEPSKRSNSIWLFTTPVILCTSVTSNN